MEMAGIWLFKRKFAEICWQFRYAESIEKTYSKVSITLLFIIFSTGCEIALEAVE